MFSWLNREGQRVVLAILVGALLGGLNAHAHQIGTPLFPLWVLLGACTGWIMVDPLEVLRHLGNTLITLLQMIPQLGRRIAYSFRTVPATFLLMSSIFMWLSPLPFFHGITGTNLGYALLILLGISAAVCSLIFFGRLFFGDGNSEDDEQTIENYVWLAAHVNPMAVLAYYLPTKWIPWLFRKLMTKVLFPILRGFRWLLMAVLKIIVLCHSTARMSAFVWAGVGAAMGAKYNHPLDWAIMAAVLGRMTYELFTVRLFRQHLSRTTS